MSFFETYGFTPFFQDQCQETPSLQAGRVINVQKGMLTLATEGGERLAQISGRLSYSLIDVRDYPTVGDWVLFRTTGDDSMALIERCLDRQCALERKQVGAGKPQLIAANIDTVFLVQSCNQDLNIGRLERYLAACGASNIKPVLIFNKADLLPTPELPFTLPITWSYPYHVVSAESGLGIDSLEPYLQAGQSVVLIGSSGVGKSTLINKLTEQPMQKTAAIREGDDKGRHTTTTRSLLFTTYGGMIIDTPGMREFGLAHSDVEESGAFDDIDALSQACRFRNCQHESEPGCAVRAALEANELDPRRLDNLRKLKKEEDYYRRRENPELAANAKRRWKQINKDMRKHPSKRKP